MRFLRVPGLVLVAAISLAGCRKDHFADGIGRPVQEFIDPPQLQPLAIARVFPASAGAFVELVASGPVTLTNFQLEIPGQTPVPVQALHVDVGPFSAVGGATNVAQSGEVALVETATGVVHSYLAWGRDPASGGSTLAGRAVQSGAFSGVTSVPFPRPAGSLVVRDVGCLMPGDLPCAPATASLRLDEVGPRNAATDTSFMEIKNIAGGDLDVTGVRVCHDGGCAPLDSLKLGAGATLVVCAGEVAACPGVTLAGTTAIAGDTEAFLAAPETGSPSAATLLDYMRTSGGPQALESAAIGLGLWTANAAPLGTYVAGESLSRNPGAGTVWNPARATPGAANPTIDRVTNWQTCAEPATVSAAPALVASVMSRADGTVTITNAGTSVVSVADVGLRIDDVDVALTGTTLAPNASVTVQAAIADSGKLELRFSGTLIQFAQWGNPAAGVTAAIAANVWPRGDCILPRLATGESLVARDRSLVRGSGGYDVQ